jgi:hypothetical protein
MLFLTILEFFFDIILILFLLIFGIYYFNLSIYISYIVPIINNQLLFNYALWLYHLNLIIFFIIIIILVENYLNSIYLDYLKEDYLYLSLINKFIKYNLIINCIFYMIN